MHVRRGRPEDAGAVLTLWNAAEITESVTDTIEDLQRIANNAGVAFFVAVMDDSIVGSIIATFDGWPGNMYRLITHPDYRRKGVALALVHESEKLLAVWGAKRITALVERDHPWALRVWEAAGYAADERMLRYVRNPLAAPNESKR